MLNSHLYLVGYRGSGKSSVGVMLAERLHRPFLDTDGWIENYSGRSIPEIFEQDGEQSFRDLETFALHQLPGSPPMVVSLGGGAVLRDANREILQRTGKIVWLRADPAVLAARIAADQARGARRPSLTGLDPVQEVEQVLSARESIYRDVADWELETSSQPPSELARAIADWYASIVPR
jgi:shikimate kinase